MGKIGFPLEFERRFELWSSQISHGVLLLRANIRPGQHDTRIDLMFRGVTALRLRSFYSGLVVDLVASDRYEEVLGEDVGVVEGEYVFSIGVPGGPRGFVVALSMFFAEDDMEYGEVSAIDHPEFDHRVVRSGYYE